LLLEGDDLEALLLRAHAEAGANARIVRAEKVRRGGILGFFARPIFEVAVEIPDSSDGAPRPAPGVGSVLPTQRGGRSRTASSRSASSARDGLTGHSDAHGGEPDEEAPATDPALAIAETRVDPEPQTHAPFRPGILDSTGRDIVAAASTPSSWPAILAGPAPAPTSATDLPAATHPAPAPAVEPAMPVSTPAVPSADQPEPAPPPSVPDAPDAQDAWDAWDAPEVAAEADVSDSSDASDDEFTAWLETSGVLGMARRTPAERAAARVITLQPEDYRVNPDQVTPLSAPDVLPVSEDHLPIALDRPVEGPQQGEGVHWTHEPHDAQPQDAQSHDAQPETEPQPAASAPETAQGDPVLLGHADDVPPGPTPAPRTAQVAGTTIIPQERAAPHRLPTERATLGALFEHLRAGVRRPRHRTDAPADLLAPVPVESPEGWASEAEAPAPGATPSPALPRVQGPMEPTVVSAAPSGRAQTAARTSRSTTRAATGEAIPVPAPRTPTEAETSTAPDRRRTPRHVDSRLTADRRALRALGVPGPWTRRLRGGDRFPAVLAILDRMPEVDIDPDAAVVAVVGPPGVVVLEAHRTALDLPVGHGPRPVITIGAEDGPQREQAVAAARRTRPVVVAVEIADYTDTDSVRGLLRSVHAEAVIAVVDARRRLEDTTRWLEALERVDALAVEGGLEVPDPAAALHLELPVIRLDGIPLDRFGWTALLCAWLQTRGM
jgi:hypothetical protein